MDKAQRLVCLETSRGTWGPMETVGSGGRQLGDHLQAAAKDGMDVGDDTQRIAQRQRAQRAAAHAAVVRNVHIACVEGAGMRMRSDRRP